MSKVKTILDTNSLVRLIIDDIPAQANQTQAVLTKAKTGTIKVLVPQIVIFELHFVLTKLYHLPKDEVITKLKALISTKYINIESRQTFLNTIRAYETTNQLSLVDCFLLAISSKTNSKLFTFDQKLKKAAQKKRQKI